MTEQSPATFNVEDWLTDAALPQESATIYKRADVVAELTELKRQIGIVTDAQDAEPTAGTKRPATLIKQYEQLLRTFSGSALTVYVRALTGDELRAMKAAHEERTKALTPAEQNIEFGFDMLAAAIVAVKPAGAKEPTPTAFSVEQVKALKDGIGETQMQLILQARQQAQNGLPTVDADFLPQRSGTEAGPE